ncbi:MAG: hypothetical protein J5720_00435 [Bacteroidaceae bacterium]|nr:hypothetical protein [Bacteroidaceae bacterium]
MKRLFMIATMVVSATTLMAQDMFEATNVATKDLNGTARYVGMGGALSALGGEISVMGSNPAGTGLFRKSDAAFTVGGIFGSKGVLGHDGSRMSLDNAGILISLPTDEGNVKYVNFGVNYVKNKNFMFNQNTPIQNLNVGGVNLSQTYQIATLANESYFNPNGVQKPWGALTDMSTPLYDDDGNLTKYGLLGEDYVTDAATGVDEFTGYTGFGADDANMRKATYGGITQADINLSLNVLDKYFFGASVGLYDINYNRESFYEESISVPNYGSAFYDFTNWYKTTGDGVDLKLGFICRPIDDSPFRFGLTVHTPTWYKMEDVNGSVLHINDVFVSEKYYDPYHYDLRTPWKLGCSLGYTIDNYFAIGAEYEYQDLSSMKYSMDGHQTNYFRTHNDLISKYLKGQNTFKIGMEVKPTNEFSIRAGYNYVSAPMKNDAYKILAYDGPFTETDFTNWKAINRFTVGLGYRYKGGYIDVAYQYSGQKGDFYAFDDIDLKPTEIENNRSQIMCTVGFRF